MQTLRSTYGHLNAVGDIRSTLGPEPLGALLSPSVPCLKPSSPPPGRGVLASFAELAKKLSGEKDGQ